MNDAAPATDPASLSRLHDIVSPPPVSWWPLAPGWYVVGAALVTLWLWSLWRFAVSWRRNAYRREALKRLKALPMDSTSLPQLDKLLKRVALSAWPREQVASLSGVAWLEFLDRTAGGKNFVAGAGRVLGDAAYLPSGPQVDVRAVLAAAENWIRHHEVERSC